MSFNHRFFTRVLFFLFLLAGRPAAAQQDTLADPDGAFKIARELAFSGKRGEARMLALRIAERYPSYLDVKTFIGRTYAWDRAYDSARKQFAAVKEQNPKSLDNYIAWIDAERWAGEYRAALILTDTGLLHHPSEVELLYRKAQLHSLTGQLTTARDLAQQILRFHPDHKLTVTLLMSLRGQSVQNGVAAGFTYGGFSKGLAPVYYSFIQGNRVTRHGAFIARVNYASRAGQKGIQPELEAYPKLHKGTYAYLNYGYSAGPLFPKHRLGAELFVPLTKSLEASFGLRQLYFGRGSTVTFYTGSVGLYKGNYWFSLRPTVTPDSAGTGFSGSFTARRYFKSADHFLSLRVGAGLSPELQNFQTASGTLVKGFYNLGSQSGGISYQLPFSKSWILLTGADFIYQQTGSTPDRYLFSYALSSSLRYRLK